MTKKVGPVTELLRGSPTPTAHRYPQGGHAQYWPKYIEYTEQAQTRACGCSTCSYWSPEYQDIFLFEIGQKMAELWAKNVCPNMGASAKLRSFCPVTWPNINIYRWDQLYMISRPWIHILTSLQHNTYYIVVLRPKIDKIGNISVRVFAKAGCAKFPISSPFFKIFARNFQDARRSEFRPYVTIGNFDKIFAKNLAAKFWNLPGKFWIFAAKFFAKILSKFPIVT